MQKQGLDAARPTQNYVPENIIFCIDVDREVDAEMKSAGTFSRMEAVKQALLLFVHSKLTANPNHQFAFVTLGRGASWYNREYTNDLEHIGNVIRNLRSQGSYPQVELSSLLELGASEGKVAQSQGRHLRLLVIYCRSSVVPHFPEYMMNRQSFTLDALYMHDKPAPQNCPQKVYDALVDVLEHVSHYEGYIFESSSGSARMLFRHVCLLLSHPQQRIPQDDFTNGLLDFAQMKPSTESTYPPPRPAEEVGSAGAVGGQSTNR